MIDFKVRLPTVRQLQCFLAVARELNFRRAAEQMRMTQPPLTRQIQCLEDIIGSALFTRDTHQVHLTDVGRQLESEVSQLLDQLIEVMKGLQVGQTKVKLGATRTLDFSQIPALNKALEQMKDIDDVSSHQLTSRQLLKMLARGELDIALVGETNTDNDQNFCFYPIHKESMMLAMPNTHPASSQDRIELSEVADLPLYWFSRSANPRYYDKCETYLQQLPFTLKRKSEPDDSLIMLAGIARGKGIALMPASMCVSTRDGLCYRQLAEEADEKLAIDIYLAVRRHENKQHVLHAKDEFLSLLSS